MRVQVDQPRRDDEAGNVADRRRRAAGKIAAEAGDAAVREGDVGDAVMLLRRIDDATALENQVVAHGRAPGSAGSVAEAGAGGSGAGGDHAIKRGRGSRGMLFREEDGAVVAVSQPAHAWLSGQLARAWGNDRFAPPAPREEVCLAAELHDLGWFDWETAPSLDPETGRPYDFRRLPKAGHTGLWRTGVRRARLFGRLPALLVSLHADTIYSFAFDPAKAAPEVTAFLDEQHALQDEIVASLRADPAFAANATPAALEASRLLIAHRRPDVPRNRLGRAQGRALGERAGVAERNGRIAARAGPRARHPRPRSLAVRADRLDLKIEGRRLRGRFRDEAAMRRALEEAEPAAIAATLRRPD